MCYIMLYMLEWMWKEKHKIGTLREHESYVIQACRPISKEKFLKDYIFIMYKSVIQ